MSRHLLEINHLTKSYAEDVVAVEDLSLAIEPGDIFAFIGKNGSGKTTTLRCVTGILDYDEGEVLIDGQNLLDSPVECKSKIAYIPDNPDLYDFMTGIQYLTFIADVFGIDPTLRNERIEIYAELLELKHRLGDLVSSFSHGMKQKLALLSGFLHEPLLFMMDEPFVGLDPEAVVHVRRLITQFCARGSAVFFSTHVLEVAQKLCNKVAFIHKGRLVAVGKTQEILKDGMSLEDFFLEKVDHE
jgi:ABC-2 type transport system ATP-binding protein